MCVVYIHYDNFEAVEADLEESACPFVHFLAIDLATFRATAASYFQLR